MILWLITFPTRPKGLVLSNRLHSLNQALSPSRLLSPAHHRRLSLPLAQSPMLSSHLAPSLLRLNPHPSQSPYGSHQA